MSKLEYLLIPILLKSCWALNTPQEDIYLKYPMMTTSMNVWFLFMIILISTLIRTVLVKYDFPTPYSAFMIIGAILWGILCNYSEPIFLSSDAMHISSKDIFYIYLPILIFNTSFCLDVPIFVKSLPQIIVIALFVGLSTGLIFGLMMRMIIDPTWSVNLGLTFAVFCHPINPANIVYLLRQQTTRTKHISVLLEGEAVFSLVFTELTYELIHRHILHIIEHIYQFVAIILIRFCLFGIAFGYLMGFIGRLMMRKMYRYPFTIYLVSFGMPFFTYFAAEIYISGCGGISVMILGTMMGMERTVLAKNTNKFLTDFWDTIGFIMDAVVCVKVALIVTTQYAYLGSWTSYFRVVVTYLIYYSVRFICFLFLSPIISRLSYGMDLKTMLVCVWGGLKSPFSLTIASTLLQEKIMSDIISKILFLCLGFYFLSILINGTSTRAILDFLGLRQISIGKKMNMTNCMKHIFAKRDKTVAILKMDRFLADVNWPVVMEATEMKHPYRIGLEEADEDNFFLGYRYTVCPDCRFEIRKEPTPKELKDMRREAKIRVLKAKKMCYSRQYENGMMTKEGIRIMMQAVELAMDTEEAVIKLEGLEKHFAEENCLIRFIRRKVRHLNRSQADTIKPPRKYVRRFCYHLVINATFEKVMLVIIALHGVVLTIDLVYHPPFSLPATSYEGLEYVISIFEIVCTFIYAAEFYMKIMAYSWIHVWDHGVKTYCKSIWRILDFIVLVAFVIQTCFNFNTLISNNPNYTKHYGLGYDILSLFRILRFVRLLSILKIFYPKLMRYLDRIVDSELAFTYELGKSYAMGEAEILEMLPYTIDNKKIREEIKQKIEHDKVVITKLLGLVQKEKPWIAITVKTKQAIRTILNSMKEAMNQLKIAGWIDNYEQEKLNQVMGDLYTKVNSIKTVQPSPPKVIFREVAWMAGDQPVIDFLFENVTVKKFEPGDIVFGEGQVADGIYIVVTGLLMLNYKPDTSFLTSLEEFGKIPIADYVTMIQYDEPTVDYIVSGNCLGERSILSERAYNCTITAEAHSQVYVLNKNIIRRAMELSPDPVVGLECRLWKEVSIRLALPLLMAVPAYQGFGQDQIKYALERSFVPNLENFKVFVVTDVIEDIILVEGVAADYNTREMFIAPHWIPRTVQKLILPNSGLLNIPFYIETKLMIIPEKDVDEYDVMLLAEDTCELVTQGSSLKCLLHAVQQKTKKKKINLMRGRRKTGVTKAYSKYKTSSIDSTGFIYFKQNAESDTHSTFLQDEVKSDQRINKK